MYLLCIPIHLMSRSVCKVLVLSLRTKNQFCVNLSLSLSFSPCLSSSFFFFVIFLAISRNEFDWEPLAMNSIKQRKRDVYIKLFDGKEVEVQTNPVCVPCLCLCARILQSRNSWKSSNRIMMNIYDRLWLGLRCVFYRVKEEKATTRNRTKMAFFFVVTFVGYNWFSPGVFVFIINGQHSALWVHAF